MGPKQVLESQSGPGSNSNQRELPTSQISMIGGS